MKKINITIIFNTMCILSFVTTICSFTWLMFFSSYVTVDQICISIVFSIPLLCSVVGILIARRIIKATLSDPNTIICNMVIHEFRNVLTVTIGYSEMLLLNPKYEESDLIRGIYDKSLEALEIIKHIKDE